MEWLNVLGPSVVPLLFDIGGCAEQPREWLYRLMGLVPIAVATALLPILRSGGLETATSLAIAATAGCAAAGYNMLALSLCF